MLSQPITFAEGNLSTNPLISYPLVYFSLYLVIIGIATFLEIKSYRRQGKRWIWYKRPSAIAFLTGLVVAIGGFLFIAPIATVNSTDIEHLPPYSVGFRVLIAMVGAVIALVGGGSLALYSKSLAEEEKKEEQSPGPKR